MRLTRLTTRRLLALVAIAAVALGLSVGFFRLPHRQQDILGGVLLLLALPLSPLFVFLLVRLLIGLLSDPPPQGNAGRRDGTPAHGCARRGGSSMTAGPRGGRGRVAR